MLHTKTFISLSLTLAATPVLADSELAFDGPMAPANNQFEIAVGGGYMQTGGKSGIGDISDIAGPGGSAEIQLGHRLTPNLLIGGYGTLEGFSAGSSLDEAMNDVVGASAGLKADWHFRPTRAVDPWISVGGGMRWIWVDQRVDRRNTETVSLRGFDLARLSVGIDYRITPNFAIAPTIGATATTYFDKDTSMTAGYEPIDDKHVSWTFGAGLLGRFDL